MSATRKFNSASANTGGKADAHKGDEKTQCQMRANVACGESLLQPGLGGVNSVQETVFTFRLKDDLAMT